MEALCWLKLEFFDTPVFFRTSYKKHKIITRSDAGSLVFQIAQLQN